MDGWICTSVYIWALCSTFELCISMSRIDKNTWILFEILHNNIIRDQSRWRVILDLSHPNSKTQKTDGKEDTDNTEDTDDTEDIDNTEDMEVTDDTRHTEDTEVAEDTHTTHTTHKTHTVSNTNIIWFDTIIADRSLTFPQHPCTTLFESQLELSHKSSSVYLPRVSTSFESPPASWVRKSVSP